jgi:hypothetical protein
VIENNSRSITRRHLRGGRRVTKNVITCKARSVKLAHSWISSPRQAGLGSRRQARPCTWSFATLHQRRARSDAPHLRSEPCCITVSFQDVSVFAPFAPFRGHSFSRAGVVC